MRRPNVLACCTIGLIALFATGCQKSSNPSTEQSSTAQSSTAPASTDTNSAAAPATDAADGNLASTDQTTAPAPEGQGNDANYDTDADTEPAVYASQAPPELPDYSQPECPGENYVWTPGYWDYSSSGYYWVPGTWVVAPYVGALWTPPYWGFQGGRYRLHHGYWAQHIGFYGGINYGFGYTGRGYYGGYWNNGQFNYNRSVTNVNTSVVHNVYSRNVVNTSFHNDTRVSYNGGNGGVRAQPVAAEQMVLREQRRPPVPAQIQQRKQSATNRAQFARANQGRPAVLAAARPLPTAYHTPAPAPSAAQPRGAAPNPARSAERPGARPEPAGRQPAPAERPGAPAPNQPARGNVKPEARPTPAQPRPETRPAPAQPRPEARPAPAQPRPEARPAPEQPRPEARPAPAQPRPEAKPAPAQPRPEARPAPAQPKPEAKPAAHPGKATEARPNAKGEKANTKDTQHH